MEKNRNNTENMVEVKKKTAYPFWAAAAVWVAAALFFPMYKIIHYLIIALLSAAAGLIAYKLKPYYTVLEPAPKKRFTVTETENAEIVNKILDFSDGLLKLQSSAPAHLSADVASIRDTLSKIADSVKNDPNDAKKCRRLINYYLPTVEKLAEKYLFLSNNSTGKENISASLEEIEGAFRSINDILKKQLDSLFENDALDISTEISVLETLLKNDKLS